MAFPNLTDIVTTTIEKRTKKIADNVSKNTALLAKLQESGNVKPVSGGRTILQELSFAENPNFQFYSGADPLNINPADVISAAEFAWKQAACAVTITGLEEIQNAGAEQMIDLLEARVGVAEATMTNGIGGACYSDGTAFGGKQIGGLNYLVPLDPTVGIVGGIDRSLAIGTFWRNKVNDTAAPTTSATILLEFNKLWAQLVRNADRPNLILGDSLIWAQVTAAVQPLQRMMDPALAKIGFQALDYMGASFVLDGGLGGFCPASTAFFLNTKYIHYRPHTTRNMVPLSPTRRWAVNNDVVVQLIGWAGNMALSNGSLQGRLYGGV